MSETTEAAASDAVNTDDLAELLRQAKAELATKNAERNTAEERATRAERERDEARGSAVSQAEARFLAEEAAVAGRIDGFEREAAALERDQAAAMAEGRFEDAAKMSRQMAVIEARRQKDADYLTFLGTKKEEVKRQAEMPAPQQQRQQGVDLSQFSAKQRAWIDAHPEYLTDERMRQKAAAGHALAMADGIGLDTPEYFARIEEVVGIRGADDDASKSRRRDYEDTGDLPVQRNGSPGTQRRDGAIRLTPDEREAADMAFSDVPIDDYTEGGVTKPGRYKMYARNKEALKREGRL
jgi:hypothetical protein